MHINWLRWQLQHYPWVTTVIFLKNLKNKKNFLSFLESIALWNPVLSRPVCKSLLKINKHNNNKTRKQWRLLCYRLALTSLCSLPRRTLNLWSSCPCLLTNGIAGLYQHTACYTVLGIENWTYDFMDVRSALHHLSYTPALCFSF